MLISVQVLLKVTTRSRPACAGPPHQAVHEVQRLGPVCGSTIGGQGPAGRSATGLQRRRWRSLASPVWPEKQQLQFKRLYSDVIFSSKTQKPLWFSGTWPGSGSERSMTAEHLSGRSLICPCCGSKRGFEEAPPTSCLLAKRHPFHRELRCSVSEQ